MVEGAKKRVLFIAVLAVIIIGGSCYAYWQKNSVPESIVTPANVPASTDKSLRQGELTVYISGAVMQPGVIKVQTGTRIIDVINTAGGLAQGADVGKLNLAQAVKDGMHIQVPGGKLAIQNTPNAVSVQAVSGKVNINTADKKELDSLPGIGPTIAQRIIDYRQANGPFKELDHIKNVSGISDSKYSKLKDKITI